jgi:protein-tyrosine phosphatase
LSAKILVVCTANVCRSPTMAGLLALRLPGVVVQSRGLRAESGLLMCATSRKWLQSKGVTHANHASRGLTIADVRSSTLILTATRWHRAAVLEMWPAASVRTHTLAEAARVIGWRVGQGAYFPQRSDVGERVLWLAEELYDSRDRAPRPSLVDSDDLPDPHNGARHPNVLRNLLAAADRLCDSVSPPIG